MTIKYLPNKILRAKAAKNRIEKLVKKNLSLNRAALSTLDNFSVLSKKEIERIALKIIKDFKKKARAAQVEGATKSEALASVADRRQLVQRIQDATVVEVAQTIKQGYKGEYYIWLPSDAMEPDPEHQLKYGKKFQIGRGEMPGDRWGCRCGMEILVDENSLDL